ncbi:MAG: hypothetical protein FWE06_03745 [Oscillospiraceae bacterium]|nr:hypothetical protein [Oscillospiraceae bacterium]
MMEKRMNIPQTTSIENALHIYYRHAELGNKEITILFGQRSPNTLSKLKKIAKDEMREREMMSFGSNTVNTVVAFEVWGIDVKDLEHRMKKIKQLKLA